MALQLKERTKVESAPVPRQKRAWSHALLLSLIPLLLAALLAGYFRVQSNNLVQSDYYPFAWRASWIASPYSANIGCFRKVVFVTHPVQDAYLAITADNYFDVKINGRSPALFFNPGLKHTFEIGNSQTSYSELGHPRHTNRAVIFEIGHALRPGRNVIAIRVLSDTGRPRMLAQGVMHSASRDEFITDGSWKCSPIDKKFNQASWYSPHYIDADWQNAVVTGDPANVPVDGDPALFDQPLMGATIAASSTPLANVSQFQRTVDCPSDATGGWIRMATAVPYDLKLNGRLIASTATLDRYNDGPFILRGETDALNRLRYEAESTAMPSANPGVSTYPYLIQGIFRRGANQITVTLHGKALPYREGAPKFYLDGAITDGQKIAQTFWTDSSWRGRTDLQSNAWLPSRTISLPPAQYPHFTDNHLSQKVDPSWAQNEQILRDSPWIALGLLGVCLMASLLLRPSWERFWGVCKTLTAPAIFLACAAVLQGIFVYSPQDQYFGSAAYAHSVLMAAVVIWAVALVSAFLGHKSVSPRLDSATLTARRLRSFSRPLAVWLSRYGFAAAVGAVMIAGEILYTHGLGRCGFINDEYASLLAARGIVRTGVPLFQETGIIYPRSSLFHYLLAAFMVAGNKLGHPEYTRLLAGFWLAALIPVTYLLGRQLRGRGVGLAAAALVAFSPYLVFYGREVRFYTQFAFFTTWMFYFLLQSVRNPSKEGYRIGLVLTFCGAYLSQQLAFAAVPAAILVLALSNQLRLWLNWRTLAWVGFAGLIVGLDLYAYFRYCVTPLPYIDSDAIPLLALHLDNLDLLPSMLMVNYERSQFPQGILFVAGLAYVLIQRMRSAKRNTLQDSGWQWWNYLYLTTLVTLFFTTIVLPIPGSRYILQLAPLVAITACCVAVEFCQKLFVWIDRSPALLPTARLTQWSVVACIAVLFVAAYRPARMWHTTSEIINRDDTGATRFVAANRRPDDKMIFLGPQQALIEMDQCDYYWRPIKGSLYKYVSRDGMIRDRNAGAIVIDDVDKLRAVLVNHRRVWIVLPQEALNSQQMATFVSENCNIVYESFGVAVCLWDQDNNHYRNPLREHGNDQLNFE